ncbi:MAG: threonine aldolase family protein, partial [Flavobacteriales bacterium]
MKINLTSDTVTKPTPEMLEAMFTAQVGDDSFKEDPTVNALEEKAAHLFGKEGALFCPSGTMTNQIALKAHTTPGGQIICSKLSHIYNYEGGGISFNSGANCKFIDTEKGFFTSHQVTEAIHPSDNVHLAETQLISLENTTNKGGGAIWDFEEIKNIRKIAALHRLPMHLDGARLFNALVETKETTQQFGTQFDSISICLSKGLGCPVGSLIIGDHNFIRKAMRIRKLFGGMMRQSGYLAAAGLYALDHHIDRLKDDHQHAKVIAEALSQCSFVKKVNDVETNIVLFYLQKDVDETYFIKKLQEKDIYIMSMGEGALRITTHLDFTPNMLDYFLETLSQLVI